MGKHSTSGKEICCGCGACADRCGARAIKLVQDKEGFLYPRIDKSKCTGCGRCKQVCPINEPVAADCENQYFGIQAKEKEIRYSSSSGGIFPILAQYVLEQQGSVYGAGYNENMEVTHQEVRGLAELDSIKRTKYIQSNLNGIYKKIQQQLKQGQWVLFCGTPCQAQALRLFLNQSYEKLILMDLICYGVPSPGIWQNYVKDLEHRHSGTMTDFSFRDKRNRDHGHMRSFVIDGIEYAGSLFSDIYCKMYFGNYILRPSCHICQFCKVERNSDFTIGDFWGMEHLRPDLDDGMGTSLVILHTDKAREIWDQVKERTVWFACEKEQALQPRLLAPTRAAKGRGLFMAAYKVLPFSLLTKLITLGIKCKSAVSWSRRKRK
ncbi:4Fe-4S dicluster domain-containing protein [Clostridiales bacterium]|nr:4Fe-4S dicluster domain-containing protein [Clostridiales bacterium]